MYFTTIKKSKTLKIMSSIDYHPQPVSQEKNMLKIFPALEFGSLDKLFNFRIA